MNKRDRIKRAVAFYFSVALFLLLLPIVLSYSLGYKIDFHALNIYKTGIIYLKSQPAGAYIYINDRLLSDFTPARIEELKPGIYRVEIRRPGFYPWQKDLVVRPNMVTKADDIVLFALTQEMKKISEREVINFVISDKNYIYYMTNTGLFRSNADGTNIKKISLHSNWPKTIIGKRFSPDGSNILYFDSYHIWAIYMGLDKTLTKGSEEAKVEEILNSVDPIIDAYWYSESKHIVFITEKGINVVELGSGSEKRNIVTLYKFNAKPQSLYYDETNDSLYFTDVGSEPDSKDKSHLYRLDLRQKFLDQLMKRLKKEFDIRYEKKEDI